MPPSKKEDSKGKTFRNYTQQNMEDAIAAVKNKQSFKSAAKQYGVPRVTLMYKCKGKIPVQCRMGPPTNLTMEEENIIVEWLFHIANRGFPATKLQLINSVQLLCKNLNRQTNFTNGIPGKKWFSSFLKRHPEVAPRVSQNLTSARSSLTEQKIRGWFAELGSYMKENNYDEIFNDPRRIFNADETAFFLSPKSKKVLVKAGEKSVYNFVANDDKECITTLFTANASGMLVPPMVVFTYERIPANVASLMPDGWGIGKSESGWMTGETFYEYVANIMYPWIMKNNIPFPIVFFVDGHVSHLTLSLSNFCTEKGIILVALYPNATHILQPMDVAVFHPLKSGWKDGVHEWRIQNEGKKIKKENFAPLLLKVTEKCITPETIINGFERCGLCPLNPDAINYKKIFKISANSTATATPSLTKETIKLHLKFLETRIPQDILWAFKSSEDVWAGPMADTSLFNLWRGLVKDLKDDNGDRAQKEIRVTEDSTVTQRITLIEEPSPITEVEIIQTPTPNEFSEIEEMGTEENHALHEQVTPEKQIKSSCQVKIPTPFRKSLFWPQAHKSSKPKRSKEKIPSVATSTQWKEYHLKKQKEKERKELEKQERKRKREEKKNDIAKKKLWQKKVAKDQWSSDSSVDMQLESEGEGDNWNSIDADFENDDDDHFETNDYVIFLYEQGYYPGIIKEINNDSAFISAMTPSGLNWRWPTPEDTLWYSFEDIVQKICIPLKVNSRGSMLVPEMEKYR